MRKLGHLLHLRFNESGELGRQLLIAKIFDLYKQETKKLFPREAAIQPTIFKNKTLTVQVKSAALASELRLREPQIKQRLNQALGRELVARVVYRF